MKSNLKLSHYVSLRRNVRPVLSVFAFHLKNLVDFSLSLMETFYYLLALCSLYMWFVIINFYNVPNRVKIIHSECFKRWPGNIKVYFKGNNDNSLILSELVLLLEPVVKVEEIGFGKSK